jgi:hypothetical protein
LDEEEKSVIEPYIAINSVTFSLVENLFCAYEKVVAA